MTSWLARDVYAPLWVVAAGLLTFAGVLGAGRLLLRVAGLRIPAVWEAVTSMLLGIQVLSLGVQLLGMAALASRFALIAWLALFWIAALGEIVRAVRAKRGTFVAPAGETGLFWVALALVVISLAMNLVIASAPSTKGDEIYYHMLVPSRLVHDHALAFYLFPFEAAWLPQMAFQIAGAPLHAALLPDAPNVLSWALSATMVWFCYRLQRDAGLPRAWAAMWCAAIIVGQYSAVWYVTGGAHAMGELAIVALTLAVFMPELLRAHVSDKEYALTIGVLASAAVMTKLSTVPIVAFLLVMGVAQLTRGKSRGSAIGLCVAALAPMIVLWVPLVVWTWYRSGAPFGPFFSWWFPHSVYAPTPIRALVAGATTRSRHGVTALDALTRHSPLLLLGALGALITPVLPARRRALAVALLAAQGMVILTRLPWDPRFLSGLPIGLAMLFALDPRAWALGWFTTSGRRIALSVLLVPWILAPLYYARPFARVVFGIESPEQFREKFVGFNADYRKIDSLLPADAVLLTGGRISAVYAPRLPVWSLLDVHTRAPVYQLTQTCDPFDPSTSGADTVYRNPAARAGVYRTPGRPPLVAPLCVRRLVSRQHSTVIPHERQRVSGPTLPAP
jgi:hypothetical protein